MDTWRNFRIATLILLSGFLFVAAGGQDFSKKKIPDMLAVTDVTDEGRAWPQPEPNKPVLYEAIFFGTGNFPGMPGDKVPNAYAMRDLVVKTLAQEGYSPAPKRGIAKVFLSITWGLWQSTPSMLGFLGAEKTDLMGKLAGSDPWSRSTNVYLKPGSSKEAQLLMLLSDNNMYFISIQAFDLEKLDAGQKVLLWHTRMACDRRGFYMADAVPTLIVAAGPYVGRETKKPVWQEASEFRKAHVEMGETKTLELIQPNASTEKPAQK